MMSARCQHGIEIWRAPSLARSRSAVHHGVRTGVNLVVHHVVHTGVHHVVHPGVHPGVRLTLCNRYNAAYNWST